MIILPERSLPRGRILVPQRPHEWRQPSQRRSIFGIENLTRFRLTARLDDGHIVWRGWFDDREDADAFIYAIASGSLQYDRELWRLPNPYWYPLGEDVSYEFLTFTYITSVSGSNQTWNVPVDWNSTTNSILCWGGGGSGSASGQTNWNNGGGGGAFSQTNNLVLTQSGTAKFFLNVGGAAVSTPAGGTTGNPGPDTWFSNTAVAPTSTSEGCLAKGGEGGKFGTPPAAVLGGQAASCIGTFSYNGGGSPSQNAASGGGGAAGPNGVGSSGAAGSGVGTNGGDSDAGFGGSGGIAALTGTAGNGNDGTEYGSYGSGGGGGGSGDGPSAHTGGNGGRYGAGGGGATSAAAWNATSGSGLQGLIIISYEPFFLQSGGTLHPAILFRTKRMVGY